MTPTEFHAIYRELIEENPIAIRAVLKVLTIEFTTSVPTLAVTCEAQPRLLVNLDFVTAHCRFDAEVKAVLCHEFLHVLLRHTERFQAVTPELNLATDAVINAIIHRTLGTDYSRMMSRYYAKVRGLQRLLRPPTPYELDDRDRAFHSVWRAVYDGTLVVDDIEALARELGASRGRSGTVLIGNHDPQHGERSDVLEEALERALRSMNGAGIFRGQRPGMPTAAASEFQSRALDVALHRWRRETMAVLKRHLEPDRQSAPREADPRSFLLPVLSPGDRRATVRALWSPFLPEARWETTPLIPRGSAQVYLDVSGSMHAEMPLIVSLLAQLSGSIRRPFWAFSNEVAPATIRNGQLISETTGGTSMGCVLAHVAKTRPSAAVIVTDGYIETLNPAQVAAAAGTRLHVIVTREGTTSELQRVGLPYTQLSKVPS